MKRFACTCTSTATLYLGLCAAAAMPAFAQMAGVSHPEPVPISITPDGIPFPVAREAYVPGSKPSAAVATLPATQAYAAPQQSEAVYLPYSPATDLRPSSRVAPVTPLADPDAGIVTTYEGPANQLPVGSVIKVNLGRDLSTVTTASGSAFSGEIVEPVKRDGRVLLPAGSILSGRITDVHGGRRISGAASIHLEAASITLPDGTRYSVRAQVTDTDDRHAVKVDDEGSLVRRGHPGQTAAIFALTTGSGIAAGAVAAGPAGALVGAGIGAGVSTVVWLKQDRQESIPAGTRLVFSLTQSLTVGVE